METAIAAPLSGLEVRKALADRIVEKLGRDCFLSPNSAYEGFEAVVKVHLRLKDVGRYPEVDMEIPVALGHLGEDAAAMDTELYLTEEIPNQTRVETGQPVPVLVETGEGRRTIKEVQYARKQAAPNVDEPLI